MAVYSKLLLSAGGGVVSTEQQAVQAKDTATLLIGLGGTGVDCLRTIKTQVFSRLRPDNPGAPKPRYEHIRFLGVDSDIQNEPGRASRGDWMMELDDSEYFPISSTQLQKLFAAPKMLEMREELSWLCWEELAPYVSQNGAGAIRQVGRCLMMERSQAFMERVEKELRAAMAGLTNPVASIHIFSSLGGGTGSGCFLDVCYMVRHIAKKLGNISICGYFFLPDVVLSKIPAPNSCAHVYVSANGYAAMQELDYCMQLKYNGGSFSQLYQNNTNLVWRDPPVDLCHLICAEDASGNIFENAYAYAMDTVAEYMMGIFTDPGRWMAQLSTFYPRVCCADQEKTIGAHLAYCAIGGACAYIPLREINTYLASALFEQFSRIGGNVPTRADVEGLAITALARNARSITDVYNTLFRELHSGFDNSYTSYMNDWKFVRDYGDSSLITHYTNQTVKKLAAAVRNSRSMSSTVNKQSLINRVREQLTAAVRDIGRGPIFAYGLISVAQSHNLLNIIDGLLEENANRGAREQAQGFLRRGDYEHSRADFEKRRRRSLLDSDQKRFDDYEYDLMLLEQHKLALGCYQEMDNVLKLFRKQLEEAAFYYMKLARVMENLVQTFQENRNILTVQKNTQSKNGFAIPMISIEELNDMLGAEIGKINVPYMLDQFMSLLLDHGEAWIMEDEDQIAKLVSEFCIKTAFYSFSRPRITDFLRHKYGINGDNQLANKIYTDWMRLLTAKASPLFSFNSEVWQENQSTRMAFLSIPKYFYFIKEATERIDPVDLIWTINTNGPNDRILALRTDYILPLSAWNRCAEYEAMYYNSAAIGRHSYEGQPVPGMSFNDWRKLPPLTPQSLLRLDRAPEQVRQTVAAARVLYDQASQMGIFDEENRICAPDPAKAKELQALVQEAEELAANTDAPLDPLALRAMLDQLQATRGIPMAATQHRMRNDGYSARREIKLMVQKDYFVSSPACHPLVRSILQQIGELNTALDHAINAIQHSIEHDES